MRILFCSDTYPPQVNGVSVVTAISVRGLLARGWECEVVAPRYPKDGNGLLVDDGGARRTDLPSVPAPVYNEIRLAAPLWGRVREVADRFRPDIVHSATEFVVLANLVGMPAKKASAGNPIKLPPPATEFRPPANTPAKKMPIQGKSSMKLS